MFDYDSGTSAPFTGPGLSMPNALITDGGGTNIFAGLKQSWTSVSWEQVVAADPQCIIINNYGTPTAAQKEKYLESCQDHQEPDGGEEQVLLAPELRRGHSGSAQRRGHRQNRQVAPPDRLRVAGRRFVTAGAPPTFGRCRRIVPDPHSRSGGRTGLLPEGGHRAGRLHAHRARGPSSGGRTVAVMPGPRVGRLLAERVIEGTGDAIGTDDPVVAASIFVQGYAYRMATLAVACLTVGGIVPGSESGAMAIGLGRGRVSKVAYLEPTVFDLLDGHPPSEVLREPSVADRALTLILEQVVELHLRPLIALTREQVRIGERLLWGNVAASASTAFRTMEGCLGRWVEPLGERFFELAPPELQTSAHSSRSIKWQKGLVLGTNQLLPLLSNRRSPQMCRLQPHSGRTAMRRVRSEPVGLTTCWVACCASVTG